MITSVEKIDATKSGTSMLRQIGPAVVVAAVVLGPGSIMLAARVGCEFGYGLLWVVPVAGALMLSMTVASMQIGVLDSRTPCDFIASRIGRWAAYGVGLSVFIAIALFQASNNHALVLAARGLLGETDGQPSSDGGLPWFSIALLVAFNGVVIGLIILGKRSLYRRIERSMMGLVGSMVIAFVVSMIAAKPAVGDVALGFIGLGDGGGSDGSGAWSGSFASAAALALVATTYSVAGAFYQSYQVREKGWDRSKLPAGLFDAMVGIATLTLITLCLVVTAAATLHGRIEPKDLQSASAVAEQMRPVFGDAATLLFAFGILAGALTSFVVNAVIGGVVAADAIGRPCGFDSVSTRRFTIATLIAGAALSAIALLLDVPLLNFITFAQGLTVLAFPALALTIAIQWWSLERRGERRNFVHGLGISIGVVTTMLLAVRTLANLIA